MTTSIRRLLDAGADPNIKDADGRTCMYYAVRDELPSTTIDLLKEYGAKESQLAKMETKGELFGRVQATEQVRKDRRETQQRQEAVEAQVKMNENLRLLNERGEKIEDLGNKASELNANASNFASMAKQLKEKSKKQSKWLPFL
jgi:Synaptobrevin